ncbi:MAG: hypothetical protein ABFS16_02450 [Bacteroidota bacterium]
MSAIITEEEVLKVQQGWGDSVVQIGKLFLEKKDFRKAALKHVEKFYGYEEGIVLFKPTKACQIQFRSTPESAVSYFVGSNNQYAEDHGFALQPWTKVRFENCGFILEKNYAISMGNYFFTDLLGNEVKVEYTFGFFRAVDGSLKINLHHSSLPFSND